MHPAYLLTVPRIPSTRPKRFFHLREKPHRPSRSVQLTGSPLQYSEALALPPGMGSTERNRPVVGL